MSDRTVTIIHFVSTHESLTKVGGDGWTLDHSGSTRGHRQVCLPTHLRGPPGMGTIKNPSRQSLQHPRCWASRKCRGDCSEHCPRVRVSTRERPATASHPESLSSSFRCQLCSPERVRDPPQSHRPGESQRQGLSGLTHAGAPCPTGGASRLQRTGMCQLQSGLRCLRQEPSASPVEPPAEGPRSPKRAFSRADGTEQSARPEKGQENGYKVT